MVTYRSETSAVPSIVLNDGHVMPKLGFGVFKVEAGSTVDTVATALRVGYRSIDTAAIYGNEAEVGRAIAESGLPRDELFITTKLWNRFQGYDSTLRAFDESMKRLELDVLDLYLIHWPIADSGLYVDTFRALQALKAQGRITSIGVSNFTRAHLERVIEETGETPTVNQIELHPYLTQNELRAFHAEHGIITEAWSPLGRGAELEDSTIVAIAEETSRTPAQVILRWHMQLGNVAIPKSVTPDRIAENFEVFDFELNQDQVARISALDSGTRIGPNPDEFQVDAPE
ncbi:aldo/keto reductase [Nocardia sp. NBC_01503]|uniref:aldo/keto reductase n=1 Tax=Nocardia sp. NBC_01503 TaxID=2975997 RepID=UPI003FA526AE|nr:aldo/keto reductase [Nocardia sp. NBC_01503]